MVLTAVSQHGMQVRGNTLVEGVILYTCEGEYDTLVKGKYDTLVQGKYDTFVEYQCVVTAVM